MSKLIDLIGKRYGHVTVIGRAKNPYSGNHHAAWLCRCDCGKEFVALGDNLRANRYVSCGCERSERAKKQFSTHGMSNTRLYKIWLCMRSRCYYEKNNDFKWYGARGIKVCDEWMRSFESFSRWALSHGYDDTLSIDRIDCNQGYSPENCRWATAAMQANNTRDNHMLTFQGKTQSMALWAKETGLKYGTIKSRLQYGWNVEKALTTPARKLTRHKSNGE